MLLSTKNQTHFSELIVSSNTSVETGDKLANMMIDHGVGVMVKVLYQLKKIDTEYFSEE